jgi:hypothetical protein
MKLVSSFIVHATVLFALSAVGGAHADDSPVKPVKHALDEAQKVAGSTTPVTLATKLRASSSVATEIKIQVNDEFHERSLLNQNNHINDDSGIANNILVAHQVDMTMFELITTSPTLKRSSQP